MEFSDAAYTILGDVIAKASGQNFEAYMKEHVLSPLGMAQSSFLLDDVDANLLAQPHVMEGDQRVLADQYPYHRPFGPSNNLLSNVVDMARFAQAPFEQVWSDGAETPFADFPFGDAYPAMLMMEWGPGWFHGESAGHPVYTNFGREYGFQSQLVISPDANLAVIAMGNGEITGPYYASNVSADVLGAFLSRLDSGTPVSTE